jgi:hypothetical protein
VIALAAIVLPFTEPEYAWREYLTAFIFLLPMGILYAWLHISYYIQLGFVEQVMGIDPWPVCNIVIGWTIILIVLSNGWMCISRWGR